MSRRASSSTRSRSTWSEGSGRARRRAGRMGDHRPNGRAACWGPTPPPVRSRRSRALLLRRVDDRPRLLPAPGPGGRGRRLRLDGRPRQHLLPEDLRQRLPVQPRRDPGVPRRQAVPRAVLPHPGHGRGDRADPLRDLRGQAAHPPPGAGGQAGHLHRRAHRQPAGPRGRDQPVARGLRDPRRALGGAGQEDGRGAGHRARAVGRRLLRASRGDVRRAAHQDLPGPHRADPHPRSAATARRPCAGRPATATDGSTGAATPRTCPACCGASPSCARRRGRPGDPSRST